VFGRCAWPQPFEYRRLPVVRSTSESRFDAMVRGDRVRRSSYARARSLGLARALLGETAFSRAGAARTEKT
jgi:hypothetical protein